MEDPFRRNDNNNEKDGWSFAVCLKQIFSINIPIKVGFTFLHHHIIFILFQLLQAPKNDLLTKQENKPLKCFFQKHMFESLHVLQVKHIF
ncbi:hypothetical protein ACJX0J_021155, partial [Zea mays]